MQMWTDILAGGLIAIFAFCLAVAWDVWRLKKVQGHRDEAVLRALRAELHTNARRLAVDLARLAEELALLPKDRHLVEPLSTLATSAMRLAQINPPEALLRAERLVVLTKISDLLDETNEQIQSRELYRLAGATHSNFKDAMKIRDDLLVAKIAELQTAIKELDVSDS